MFSSVAPADDLRYSGSTRKSRILTSQWKGNHGAATTFGVGGGARPQRAPVLAPAPADGPKNFFTFSLDFRVLILHTYTHRVGTGGLITPEELALVLAASALPAAVSRR